MDPELYLGLGDYSYSLSADCRLNIIKPVSDSFKIAIGNHDTLQRKLDVYIDKFGLANQYYSFDYFNTHFISLSTELDDDEQIEQLTFVRNDLVKTKSNEGIDWIIVFFHKPFYSGKFDITNMRDDYHPLFEEFGVDLVIQGHSHNYQRTYPLLFNEANPSQPIVSEKEQIWYRDPKGIIFVVAGTGGESIQTLNKKSILASSYEGYGCINVEVNGKSLSAEYYSDTSDTIDRFLITKEPHDSNNTGKRKEVQRVEYDNPTK